MHDHTTAARLLQPLGQSDLILRIPMQASVVYFVGQMERHKKQPAAVSWVSHERF